MTPEQAQAIEQRRQAGQLSARDAYDILRHHLEHDPGDGSVDEYEALDVLWTSPCQLSHSEHYAQGWHAGHSHAYTAALKGWQQQ